jgi:hypothetical protein
MCSANFVGFLEVLPQRGRAVTDAFQVRYNRDYRCQMGGN